MHVQRFAHTAYAPHTAATRFGNKGTYFKLPTSLKESIRDYFGEDIASAFDNPPDHLLTKTIGWPAAKVNLPLQVEFNPGTRYLRLSMDTAEGAEPLTLVMAKEPVSDRIQVIYSQPFVPLFFSELLKRGKPKANSKFADRLFRAAQTDLGVEHDTAKGQANFSFNQQLKKLLVHHLLLERSQTQQQSGITQRVIDNMDQYQLDEIERLIDHNYQLIPTTKLVDRFTDLKGVHPAGRKEGLIWDHCMGLHSWGNRHIAVATKYTHSITGGDTANQNINNTQHHEVGHAIDYMDGEISQKPDFASVYQGDLSALSSSMQATLASKLGVEPCDLMTSGAKQEAFAHAHAPLRSTTADMLGTRVEETVRMLKNTVGYISRRLYRGMPFAVQKLVKQEPTGE